MDNERKAALQDKRLRLSHAGNLAEAALEIHDCFCSAQKAAAHNYPSHFGRLSELQSGDVVVFTDVTGTTHRYEVVLL